MGSPVFSTTKKRLKEGKGLEALPSASNRLVVYPRAIHGGWTIPGVTTLW